MTIHNGNQYHKSVKIHDTPSAIVCDKCRKYMKMVDSELKTEGPTARD
jgi:hypothetical protein